MNSLASLTRTAVTLTRQVLRPPLMAFDSRVVRPRLGDGSPVHRALTTAVGLLDSLADGTGSTTDDVVEAVPAGNAQFERDGAAAAEPTHTEAAGFTSQERDQVEELTEDLLADQQDERFVGELDDDELRRVQAQIRAKQIVEDPEHT